MCACEEWVFPFPIHSPDHDHLGCFAILGISNNVVKSMGEEIAPWDSGVIALGSMPRCGLAGSYGSSIFNFLRNGFV